MPCKRAKTLTPEQLDGVMTEAALKTHGLRATVILLLSFKAGLRSMEIAGLDWADVTDADGSIGIRNEFRQREFVVPSDISKRAHFRTLPMHPQIRKALIALRKECPDDTWVIYSIYGHKRATPASVCKFFFRIFEENELVGCSSHSGRRTCITQLAREVNNYGCSLRDVQKLAGHKSLQTTEAYIAPSKQVSRLVGSL